MSPHNTKSTVTNRKPARWEPTSLVIWRAGLSILLLLVLAWPQQVYAQEEVKLVVGSALASPGANGVSIPVSISPDPRTEVSGLNFGISFDPTRLTFSHALIGSSASYAGKSVIVASPSSGELRAIIFGLNQSVIPDGTIAYLFFDVRTDSPTGVTVLDVTGAAATSPYGQAVPVLTTSGELTIPSPPTPTPVPTATKAPTNTPTRSPSPSPTPTSTASANQTPSPTATSGSLVGSPSPTPGSDTATATPTLDARRKSGRDSFATQISRGNPPQGRNSSQDAAGATSTELARFEQSVEATATTLASPGADDSQQGESSPGISGIPPSQSWPEYSRVVTLVADFLQGQINVLIVHVNEALDAFVIYFAPP